MTRGRAAVVAAWVVRVALAVVFLGAGASKLAGTPQMVDLFADVGAGQGLRVVVGVCEVAGALGLLVPRRLVTHLAGLAALGLALLMAGATVANVAVLDAGPLVTIVLLVVCTAVARTLLVAPRRATRSAARTAPATP